MRKEVETYVNQRWSELNFNSAVDLNYAIEHYQNEMVKCDLFIKNAPKVALLIYSSLVFLKVILFCADK